MRVFKTYENAHILEFAVDGVAISHAWVLERGDEIGASFYIKPSKLVVIPFSAL